MYNLGVGNQMTVLREAYDGGGIVQYHGALNITAVIGESVSHFRKYGA